MIKEITARSAGKCELCSAQEELSIFAVPPKKNDHINNCIHVCKTCFAQINGDQELDANHWRCLNDSMWSEVAGVKVVAWRILHQLKEEVWPNDLLDMIYLEEDTLAWAKEGFSTEEVLKHVDSNGVELVSGDSVVLIKDLKVKGGGFTAKRGTAVRNITLVHDNPEHIEGKVEGQRIVILTQYVKK